MQACGDALAHQLVISGMELDRVAANAVGIESVKFWRILVGAAAEREHLRTAPMLAEGRQKRRFVLRAVGFDGVLQRHVAEEQVDVFVSRRLIENLMRIEARAGRHDVSPRVGPPDRNIAAGPCGFRCMVLRPSESRLARARQLGL